MFRFQLLNNITQKKINQNGVCNYFMAKKNEIWKSINPEIPKNPKIRNWLDSLDSEKDLKLTFFAVCKAETIFSDFFSLW